MRDAEYGRGHVLEQGTPLRYARAVTEYWREHYDGRRAEAC